MALIHAVTGASVLARRTIQKWNLTGTVTQTSMLIGMLAIRAHASCAPPDSLSIVLTVGVNTPKYCNAANVWVASLARWQVWLAALLPVVCELPSFSTHPCDGWGWCPRRSSVASPVGPLVAPVVRRWVTCVTFRHIRASEFRHLEASGRKFDGHRSGVDFAVI